MVFYFVVLLEKIKFNILWFIFDCEEFSFRIMWEITEIFIQRIFEIFKWTNMSLNGIAFVLLKSVIISFYHPENWLAIGPKIVST